MSRAPNLHFCRLPAHSLVISVRLKASRGGLNRAKKASVPALAAMEEEEVLWMEMTVSLADCFVLWWNMHLLDAS